MLWLRGVMLFSVAYALCLAITLGGSLAAASYMQLNTTFAKASASLGMIINLVCFFAALSLARHPTAHAWLGSGSSPFVLRRDIYQARLPLIAAFALAAVAVDVCARGMAQLYYTGHAGLPSPARLAVLAGVYCLLAWLTFDAGKKTKA